MKTKNHLMKSYREDVSLQVILSGLVQTATQTLFLGSEVEGTAEDQETLCKQNARAELPRVGALGCEDRWLQLGEQILEHGPESQLVEWFQVNELISQR